VAPAKLLDDHIPVQQDFTHVNWVVPSNFVVWHSFILTGILLVKERVVYYFLKRRKIGLLVVLMAMVLRGVLVRV
jgi:hypothetical protein